MSQDSNKRRLFLKGSAATLGALAMGHIAMANEKKTKSAEPEMVDEKSQMAVTLKYYADGSKVPANIRPAKAGVDGPKQICVNCMFYAKTQGEKEKEIGKCQLFPKGLVPGKAWCASWTKKP
jgi:hypothetical protein